MKRIIVVLSAALVLVASVSSCSTVRSMKRDCQGGKHVRLQNGIYI